MKPPKVINIKMVNGKRPDFDVYIGRQLNYPKAKFPRSKWANPFTFKQDGEIALVMYEVYITSLLENDWPDKDPRFTPSQRGRVMRAVRGARQSSETWNLDELDGKILGCWCKPGPCHGDVLIKLFKETNEALNRLIKVYNKLGSSVREVRAEEHDGWKYTVKRTVEE